MELLIFLPSDLVVKFYDHPIQFFKSFYCLFDVFQKNSAVVEKCKRLGTHFKLTTLLASSAPFLPVNSETQINFSLFTEQILSEGKSLPSLINRRANLSVKLKMPVLPQSLTAPKTILYLMIASRNQFRIDFLTKTLFIECKSGLYIFREINECFISEPFSSP